MRREKVAYHLHRTRESLPMFFKIIIQSFRVFLLPFVIAYLSRVHTVIKVARIELDWILTLRRPSALVAGPFSWPSCEILLQEPNSEIYWTLMRHS